MKVATAAQILQYGENAKKCNEKIIMYDLSLLDTSLKSLKIFQAVYHHRSIQAAASEMGIPFHTARQSLKRLEKRLNIKLFNSTQSPLAPSRDGMTFFKYVKEVLDAYEQSLAVLKNSRIEDPAGIFRIITTSTIGHEVLPLALLEHRKIYPKLRYEVLIGSEMFQEIYSHNFDICLGPNISVNKLKKVKLGSSKYYLYTKKDSEGNFKTVSDVKNQDLLLFRGNHLLNESFIEKNTVRITSNSYPFLEQACRVGHGIFSGMFYGSKFDNDLKKIDNTNVVEKEAGYAYYFHDTHNHEVIENLIKIVGELLHEKD